MTPGDSVSFVASMEPVVIQIAAIVIAAGVLWMARGESVLAAEDLPAAVATWLAERKAQRAAL